MRKGTPGGTAARGRHPDDDGRPRRPDGTPKKGKPYARGFGVPADTGQSSFTDPQSRIMKQSNGGFDYRYYAQTAVDDAHQIIVAAELTDCASDSGQPPVVLAVVKHTLGELPAQSLADTGYRSEAVFAALSQRPCQLVVALGREGRDTNGAVGPCHVPTTAASNTQYSQVSRSILSAAGS